MHRFANLDEAKPALGERADPALDRAEIPRRRIGEVRAEARPRSVAPAVLDRERRHTPTTGCSVWMINAPRGASRRGARATRSSTDSLPISAKFATATSTRSVERAGRDLFIRRDAEFAAASCFAPARSAPARRRRRSFGRRARRARARASLRRSRCRAPSGDARDSTASMIA